MGKSNAGGRRRGPPYRVGDSAAYASLHAAGPSYVDGHVPLDGLEIVRRVVPVHVHAEVDWFGAQIFGAGRLAREVDRRLAQKATSRGACTSTTGPSLRSARTRRPSFTRSRKPREIEEVPNLGASRSRTSGVVVMAQGSATEGARGRHSPDARPLTVRDFLDRASEVRRSDRVVDCPTSLRRAGARSPTMVSSDDVCLAVGSTRSTSCRASGRDRRAQLRAVDRGALRDVHVGRVLVPINFRPTREVEY